MLSLTMKLTAVISTVLQGLGLASFTFACARPQPPAAPDPVALLVQRSKESNAALMLGDVERYQALLHISQDFSLMSPFGGEPSRGVPTPAAMERMKRFFKNGSFEQELVQAYGSSDMVVLALIERARVEVGELPSQPWALRVTLVYRRRGADWELVHRHADPLVEGISLPHAALLARGEGREK